jgi:hypothetical protein
MTRYEGLFLVLAGCVLAAVRRRWLYAVVLGLAALLPAAVYAIISVSHGWAAVPNPILIKGNVSYLLATLVRAAPFSDEFWGSLARLCGVEALRNVAYVPAVALLPAFVLFPIFLRRDHEDGTWNTRRNLEILFLGTFLLHAELGSTGWLYRYEAYLVALAIFVFAWGRRLARGSQSRGIPADGVPVFNESVSTPEADSRRTTVRTVALVVLLLVPTLALARRSAAASVRTVQGSKNIYEQQYQMGLFLRDFYAGRQVTVQDIGAINYLADIRCVDVMGLASKEPLAMSLSYRFEKHVVDRWAGGRGIAVLYETTVAFRGGVPPRWVEAGEWTIEHNVVTGGATVSFFAVDPAEADRLVTSLRRFSSRLPATVIQTGLYTKSGDRHAKPTDLHPGE